MNIRRNRVSAPDTIDQRVLKDYRVSEAACLLVLVQTGVELSPETIDEMATRLSDLRDVYGVAPDSIQDAIFAHEPSLAGIGDM